MLGDFALELEDRRGSQNQYLFFNVGRNPILQLPPTTVQDGVTGRMARRVSQRASPQRASVALVPVAVLLMLLFSLATATAFRGAPDLTPSAPGPLTGDPFKEAEDLMMEFMDMINNATTDFTSLTNTVLQGINNESQRIVYTESLITQMGTQIGWMADKIVHTENIVANLTSTCFCPSSAPGVAAALPTPPQAAVQADAPNPTPNLRPSPTHTGPWPARTSNGRRRQASPPNDMPWDDLFQVIEHAIQLMSNLTTNMTQEMEMEIVAIGNMSNRIVAMECDIMDMGKQIGVMADRIVYTEELMANTSKVCCGKAPGSSLAAPTVLPKLLLSQPTPPQCKPYTPNNTANHVTSMRFRPRLNGAASHRGRRSAAPTDDTARGPFDPFKLMEKLVDEMMDEMEQMFALMFADITNGTATIGILADDILETASFINLMGENIGKMADCIVATEEIGLAMVSKFCAKFHPHIPPLPPHNSSHGICPPITPVHPPTLRALPALAAAAPPAVRPLPSSALVSELRSRLAAEARAGTLAGPISDFTELIKLFEKALETMGNMAKAMSSLFSNVMGQIASMANKIMETIGYINDFANQINQMAGRIVATEELLAKLARSCGLPSL